MKLIAILPARKGSKRLPVKNFKTFFGKSMISYPLGECVASEIFDQIVISTDDPKSTSFLIYGESPLVQIHKRSPELAGDNVTVDQVVYHLLTIDFQGYDYVCVIYPTAYAVTWQALCKSFSVFPKFSYDYCWSVGMLNYDIQPNKIDNGGFYWAKVKNFLESKKLVNDCIRHSLYDLPMIDINTIEDFAEAKIHVLTLRGERFK